MSLLQIVFYVLVIYGTVVIARFLYAYIGWWGAVPAAILSFGVMYLLFIALRCVLAYCWKASPQR